MKAAVTRARHQSNDSSENKKRGYKSGGRGLDMIPPQPHPQATIRDQRDLPVNAGHQGYSQRSWAEFQNNVNLATKFSSPVFTSKGNGEYD